MLATAFLDITAPLTVAESFIEKSRRNIEGTCANRLLLRSHASAASQKREINGVGHRFKTSRAGMEVVAGLIRLAELSWTIWITNRRVEIENTIEGAACADPLIDGLTCCFSIRLVEFVTLVRR